MVALSVTVASGQFERTASSPSQRPQPAPYVSGRPPPSVAITDAHHASGDTQTNDAWALVLETDHGSLSVGRGSSVALHHGLSTSEPWVQTEDRKIR